MLQSIRDTKGFVSDPVGFVSNRREDVFFARLAGVKTLIVAARDCAVEVLRRHEDFGRASGLGGLGGMKKLFGEDALIVSDSDAAALEKKKVLAASVVSITESGLACADDVVRAFFENVDESVVFNSYARVKILAADLICAVVLGRPLLENDQQHVVEGGERLENLSRTFWRGVTSSGYSGSVLGFSTATRKAEIARQELLKMFEESEPDADPRSLLRKLVDERVDPNLVSEALLTLTSSLGHKTTASICASALGVLADPDSDELSKLRVAERSGELKEAMHRFVLEVERLFPPAIGTLLSTNDPTSACGLDLPRNLKTFVCFHTANRDPKHYSDPEVFNSDRWLNPNTKRSLTFSFGARGCVGPALVRGMVERVLIAFVEKFDFEVVGNVSKAYEYRYLPVARPAGGLDLELTSRIT